jgi:hypothetical protein
MAFSIKHNSRGHFVSFTDRPYLSLDQIPRACGDVKMVPSDRNVSAYAQLFLLCPLSSHYVSLSF